MTDWLGTFLDISARCGDKLFQPRPVWVWARDGSMVIWSNPAGADLLGIDSLDQLKNLKLEPNSSLRRDVGNLARRLGNEGTLARLRFFRGARSVSLACSCKRFRLPDGQATILIEASGNVERGSAADDELLARFLSIDDEEIFILDSNHGVLASSGADAGFGADELPETFETNGPQFAQLDTGNGMLSVRYVATGNNEASRILVWAKALADSPSEPGEAEAETAEGQELSGEQVFQLAETGQSASDDRPDDMADRPETGTQATGQQDAAEFEAAEQEIEQGADQDDMPLPDIGLPKIPGKPIEDGDTNGDFGRQARMLRAALRKSVENTADSDAEPWPEVLDSLPKKPVRFLWQTDADDRFLFVSPGLEELVGRSSRIVGEKWA